MLKISSRAEIRNPKIPAGSTPTIKTVLQYGTPTCPFGLRGSQLATMTITICDTQTAEVVNGCYKVNVLNTGRGTIDEFGNVYMAWEPGDTALLNSPTVGPAEVQRSQVLDWTYLTASGATAVGRHETVVTITSLTEDDVNV